MPLPDLRVVIAGAGGRMGQANIRTVATTPGLVLHSAFDRQDSAAIGRDAGEVAGAGSLGIAIGDNAEAALDGADVLIDFTAPTVTVLLAELAAPRGLVHIIGTTGCSKEEDWAIQKAGSTDTDAVRAALEGLTIMTPVGEQTIRSSDHQANRGQFWGQIAESSIPGYPFKIMNPVEYISADEIMD